MDVLTLSNLAAYNAQILSVVLLATAVAAVLRIDVAGVRYVFWRGVVALCLLLPVVQGRQAPARAAGGSVNVDAGIAVTVSAPTVPPSSFDWTALVLPVLAAGATARLLWLAVSYGRLRRLRRRGERAPSWPARDELQQVIGVRCEIRYVDCLRQPATFGLLRPVILLPASLASAPEEVQRAVLGHELFHVKRRDWGWLLAEELVCAALWFNPAIWWAVSRVHQARELVVDELAVLATGRRRAYVEALMAFADETSLSPVAAFGGRRQLFHRIVMLSKEGVMSPRRLVVVCGVVVAALAAGTWQAVGAFPLVAGPQLVRHQTPGPLEQRANPITPENPIPRRVNYEAPLYPAEAEAAGARGSVTLMVTLDELGRVMEARRISLVVRTTSPDATVRFGTPDPGERRFVVNRDPDLSNRLRAVAEAFEVESIRAVEQWRYDPPAAGPISFPVTMGFSAAGQPTTIQGVVTPTVAGATTIAADGALRIGGNIRTPTKVRDVRPVYPEIAKAARVSGMVILEIRVGADGTVEDARVLRSIPLLDQAAIDAVMQWRFVPTLMNGQATPVIMTVTVNFTPEDRSPDPVVPAPIVEPVQSTPRKPMPRVVKDVKPLYPADAMAAKVQGTVEVEVTIGTDGKVTGARVIRSIPMLDEAALAAVRQWEFTKLSQPVDVTIELSFALKRDR